MWQNWGVGAGCVSVCIHIMKWDVCSAWVKALGCVWRCDKGIYDSTRICDVRHVGGVWDGVM